MPDGACFGTVASRTLRAMPGRWTPEHRAAYEETMRLRREARARGEPWKAPRRSKAKRTEVVLLPPVPAIPLADHARREFELMTERINAALSQDTTDIQRAIRQLAADVSMDLQGIRATTLRIENKAALALDRAAPAHDAQGRDPELIAAMRTLASRVGRLEASIEVVVARSDEVLALLRRIDARPPRVIEYRPDHTRQKDGGEPIRTQRRRAGLSKRGPRSAA